MKKTVFTYGIITGAIAITLMIGSMLLIGGRGGEAPDFDKGMLLGYTAIILSFVLVYFAQSSYRDNVGDGYISYGKAFQVGILVTLIASILYSLVWVLVADIVAPDFLEQYQAYELNKMKEAGATADEIGKKTAEMNKMAVDYKKPWVKAAYTFLEPFPVGLLVTLISSFLVKIKNRRKAVVA
jgi:hypothetical protein